MKGGGGEKDVRREDRRTILLRILVACLTDCPEADFIINI